MKPAVLIVALLSLVGCDQLAEFVTPIDPATRYERQGDIIFDTATGLTYDAAVAAAEREQYREMLVARGRDLPGVPLVLDEDQREELYASPEWAEYRARAEAEEIRTAKRRAEWEETCEQALPRFEGEGPGAELRGIAELMRKSLVEQCLDAVAARFEAEDAEGMEAAQR